MTAEERGNGCKAWELSRAKDAVGRTTVIADSGYRGTGLGIPHRREPGQGVLPAWKEERNVSHRKVRARVEHVFARMKTWKILRDCRLKGNGVHHAVLGMARRTSRSPAMPEIINGTSLREHLISVVGVLGCSCDCR